MRNEINGIFLTEEREAVSLFSLNLITKVPMLVRLQGLKVFSGI